MTLFTLEFDIYFSNKQIKDLKDYRYYHTLVVTSGRKGREAAYSSLRPWDEKLLDCAEGFYGDYEWAAFRIPSVTDFIPFPPLV